MDFDSYKPNVSYKAKPSKPRLPHGPTAEQARVFADDMELYEVGMEEFRKHTEAFRAAERDAMSRFKADVLAENGITDHPKADKLYEMAWERGHSSGIQEVAMYAEELSELLK